MSVRDLIERLRRVRRVAIDQGPFQLYLHGDRHTQPLTLALFEHVESGRVEAVTSVLTLQALLAEAYRRKAEARAQELGFLLPTFPHLTIAPLDAATADRAARLQARYGLELAEAVQVASALELQSELLITANDRLVTIATELPILVLQNCL